MLPVHILCYQRPDSIKKQLDIINTNKVYFSVDKPREKTIETLENYNKILDIINKYNKTEKEIILFDENLGYLMHFIKSTEFILQKEQRIIQLEDDLIPTTTFINFCNVLKTVPNPVIGFCHNFSDLYDGSYYKTFFPQFYWGTSFTKEWGIELINYFKSCLNTSFLVDQIIFLDSINKRLNNNFNNSLSIHINNLKSNLKILNNIGDKKFYNWVTDSLVLCFTLRTNIKTIRPTCALLSPSKNDKFSLTKSYLFENLNNDYKIVNDQKVFKEVISPFNFDEQIFTSILAR